MISNLETFLAIATEAHAEMRREDELHRRPKPDGTPGFVVTLDPQRRSFKQALIAIAFAGIYYEALTYFLARQQSKSQAKKVASATYREKLVALGIADTSLLDAAESFRLDRNDLMHEKAFPIEDFGLSTVRRAQSSADSALEFITAVQRAFATAR